MTKEEFDFMEVKPKNRGRYYVTLYQFENVIGYERDWLEFDGDGWDYADYGNSCYVCFIHRRE